MSELASPPVASEPVYLEVTFRRLLCIWWAYFWRHMLYGVGTALVVGFLEGLAGIGGHRLLSWSTAVVMAAVSFVALGVVLHKQFSHFTIRIVSSPR